MPSRLAVNPEAYKKLSSAERELVSEELASLDKAVRANPLLVYQPHEKQRLMHSPPFVKGRAFFGGNRSGKTTFAIVDTIIQAVDESVVPAHLKPFKRWGMPGEMPLRARVVTPDLTSTLDGVVHEKFREWCPASQFKGGSFDRGWDKQQRVLHFKNGAWVQFNSSEQEREKLGGVALHRVVYDEEPRHEIRNECFTRLTDFNGDEIFALTPFTGMAWLFNKVYEPWERGDLDPARWRVVIVDMDDNPHLDEEGRAELLAEFSGAELDARKSGRFVSFSGMIYPKFTECVIPQIERVPPGAEVFRGIDPGYRHLCGVVYAYLDADDELVVFDEIGLPEATVREVCAEMRLRDHRWGFEREDGTILPLQPNWTVIDPASRNRNNQTGRSDQQEFADNGVVTIPGQNEVGAGINRVKERLAAGKLSVTANCEQLIGEARRYRWVKDTDRSEDDARERPVKAFDHLLDALRYVVMQRPLAPERERETPTDSLRQRLLRHSLKRLDRSGADSGFGPGVFS